MTYCHQVRIRYAEVDTQRVVFNAHYLTFCDDTVSAWLGHVLGWNAAEDDSFDWMLVRTVVEWQGSATYGELLDIDVGVSRWGTTSFDTGFTGTVAGRPVFTATITYVCVQPGPTAKMAIPSIMRGALQP